MQVQVHTNQIEGSARLQEWVSAEMADRLEHFDEMLTRVVVHISDENAQKSGSDDKRCQIEARLKGHQPLSVSHKADAVGAAIDGAAEKMRHALEHLAGRLEARGVSTGRIAETAETESTDSLLEEEFFTRQRDLERG
ncbi:MULTISPECIES: HPF/RaiA family ribosome-associated protein [unclassified Pseudomonas]|uniref:HPF/RaiA family ribosome-associated protein n=1 Tax=unclassified Pseudomonas TaxID=196821 RepID=UPI00244AE4CF|nr:MULTISPECIES: HPF/RaiA family ribosome-associated protein [unclassified Pseudomonas]MDG9930299.1 HPF/RaiA family ribosome-associated protein [Pseudomonas sp. GD04042]MDH0484700.1 HPF/RaiA family ribosome-associated protein [Pseudomonas sp. GD04015]MDH0605779.1 HPF/RaiA family ribosome-associated protein [Pseudomonas sp. GD03869]MDH0896437.1 HPF/RaiA family ribosome-associated protein [Pseudomonas sp. GD03875]MDH1066834.1 HPF/RaiA family ribosome-associated protein [Pseudomonas sp. GD03985]